MYSQSPETIFLLNNKKFSVKARYLWQSHVVLVMYKLQEVTPENNYAIFPIFSTLLLLAFKYIWTPLSQGWKLYWKLKNNPPAPAVKLFFVFIFLQNPTLLSYLWMNLGCISSRHGYILILPLWDLGLIQVL